ncbi:hypothetical protein I6J80_18280 [Escherichia coli]|uniref:hypothetical protein n=1 Tax=Escherichia coli TaxID=562 RepID=UPI00176F5519|nr:hypothetical protein [Escherichia coli]EIK0416413.1 hypothetical protein [Escherichia coli]MCN3350625.1 hypothetical protein [Escherichia coli]MCN5432913.1 hypothetical protein [Escherichia coli]QRQ00569.1 hypothetical protein I6J80_18280 [Escherichia coli]HAI5188191.1 hypothetical protein [Escherichia coli]
MKTGAMCLSLLFLISGCDDGGKGSVANGADTAITMFKSSMSEGDHPPFEYQRLVFKPDQQNSSKVISGWVCGDGSMKRDDKTFNFKVRGHVIKSEDISYVGDMAALLSDTEMVKYDILYNKNCKE